MAHWKTAYASVVGTSHAGKGTPCQDACACEVVLAEDGSEILLAAVADGAGSAACSEHGSRAAVQGFMSAMRPLVRSDPALRDIDEAALTSWFDDIRDELAATATAAERLLGDYACTFLAAVVGPRKAVFVQIGDGAIAVADTETGDFSLMFWPQHGEFANSTNFLTQDGFEHALQVQSVERAVREIAIFSDGIERLVLDFTARAVHSPALRPIFGWLAGTEREGTPPGQDAGIAAYLGSDRINQRTDDDKTLLVASRAVAALALS